MKVERVGISIDTEVQIDGILYKRMSSTDWKYFTILSGNWLKVTPTEEFEKAYQDFIQHDVGRAKFNNRKT